MQSIISKVVSTLFIMEILSYTSNAQTVTITNGKTNALFWAVTVFLLSMVVTYIRVKKQKQIYEKNRKK